MRNLKTGMSKTDARGNLWIFHKGAWSLVIENEGDFARVSDGAVYTLGTDGRYW